MGTIEAVGSVVVGFLVGGGLVGWIVRWALARANRYWDSYLDQKGKQLATKEDFAQLLGQQRATAQAVESVKASISGELWMAQERWKLKRDTYAALFELLLKVSRTNDESASEIEHVAGLTLPAEVAAATQRAERLTDRMRELGDKLYAQLLIGGVWLNPEARQAMAALIAAMNEGDPVPKSVADGAARMRSLGATCMATVAALLKAARGDLGFDPALGLRTPSD